MDNIKKRDSLHEQTATKQDSLGKNSRDFDLADQDPLDNEDYAFQEGEKHAQRLIEKAKRTEPHRCKGRQCTSIKPI